MITEGFLSPIRLWWLVLVPVLLVLYWLLLHQRRNRRDSRTITGLERVLPKQQSWKRHLAVVTAVLSLAALTVAFAQPKALVDVPRQRATVVIALDVSRSMDAEDVKPNRLAAAKLAAEDFVDMLPAGFNVSLVRFAATAAVVVPPTTDRDLVRAAITNLQVSPSTAIGEGIYSSLDAVAQAPVDPDNPEDVAPAAIVLLSDGSTTSGRDSADAAREAKKQGTPIYTIAYGTEDGYIVSDGKKVLVPVNTSELSRIARLSSGEGFSAGSSGQLKQVYTSIASEIGTVKEDREITELYAGISLLFALLAALSMVSLAARWP